MERNYEPLKCPQMLWSPPTFKQLLFPNKQSVVEEIRL